MTTIVRKLWPFGWVREIARETGPYLTRWSLRRQWGDGESSKNGGWRAYLHSFHSGDAELHNHPWHWSFSVVLWGSYEERFFDGPCPATEFERETGQHPTARYRLVRWFNWIPASRFHQITKLYPTCGRVVTLFVSGPPHGRSWGFWVPGRGVVQHLRRKHERRLFEPPAGAKDVE